jgi:hypothetical protein
MGLEKSMTLESLQSTDNNQVKVAYQLLLDQRQLEASAGDFFVYAFFKMDLIEWI